MEGAAPEAKPLQQEETTSSAPLQAPAPGPSEPPAPAPEDKPGPLAVAWGWAKGSSLTARVGRESAAIFLMLTIYRLGRGLVSGKDDLAVANAEALIGWERALGIFVEQAWQAAVLGTVWMDFFDWYYKTLHFPLTGAFLVWVFLKHAGHYARVRNSFVIATLIGFVLHWAWPLLPPRLLPLEYGFVDTVGHEIYGDGSKLGPFANQVAAMPSLHFGWSLTCGVGFVWLSASRLRWLALLHPVLTLVAIVVTANHYFMDAVVAVPVMAAGLAATLWRPLATLGDARSAEARRAAEAAAAAEAGEPAPPATQGPAGGDPA